MESNNTLHYLIAKQLKRANLNEQDVCANKQEEWCDFLTRISNLYVNQEQERYLLERSLDISSREMMELHQQLLNVSRQAGMAEVATSVLHNIGNILNSANISIAVLLEMIAKSRISKLVKIAAMIKEHLSQKDDYLINDHQGKLIPDYLIALSNDLTQEYNNLLTEITNVETHLGHIKDIVAMQKDISGVVGISEKIVLKEIVDLAIQMGCSEPKTKEINIIKDYQNNYTIISDRSKLLQILINLVKNASESLMSSHHSSKQIHVTIKGDHEHNLVTIIIKDNGVGIDADNLTSIFSFGYTTKPTGHGFGLHSSAIAIKELNGEIKVESAGIGKGATFIIELPLVNVTVNDENLKAVCEKY